MRVLIGSSGYVGTTLQKQTRFDRLYRSTNIGDIRGSKSGLIVCAAAPAQKWLANQDPVSDRRSIEGLISHLETVSSENFVLISTVDVFKNPVGVDEDSLVEEDGLHPYGLHRRLLEKFIEGRFPNHLVVRLPGLVGPGLRKNVIFDFLNGNNVSAIDARGEFQFYPMINLWYDIQLAIRQGLKLVHLTAEPLSVREVSELGFNIPFRQELVNAPARYDMQSKYAGLFGGTGHYQYSRRESIQAIRAYAQSEPQSLKDSKGGAL